MSQHRRPSRRSRAAVAALAAAALTATAAPARAATAPAMSLSQARALAYAGAADPVGLRVERDRAGRTTATATSPQRDLARLARPSVGRTGTALQADLAARVAAGRALVGGMPAAAAAAPATAGPPVAGPPTQVLVPASRFTADGRGSGDLDGDRLGDVLDLRLVPDGSVLVIARKGSTGAVLWRRSVAGDTWLSLLPGAGSGRAVLMESRTDYLVQSDPEYTVGRFSVTDTWTGVDARTGATLGSATNTSDEVFTPASLTVTGAVWPAGVLQRPGGTPELLLSSVDAVLSPAAAVFRTTPKAVDLTAGSVRAVGAAVVADDVAQLSALGQVGGDGRGDVGVVLAGTSPQVSVRDGATGTALWSRTDVNPYSGFLQASRPGTDVLLSYLDLDAYDDLTVALRGGTGATRWSTSGFGVPVGDATGDGVGDVLLAGFSRSGFGISGTLLDQAGRTRWSRDVNVPFAGSGFGVVGLRLLPDVDGDAVGELGYTMVAVPDEGTPAVRAGYLSGRTGAPHGPAAPGLVGPLDGAGSDAATVVPGTGAAAGTVLVTATRGNALTRLYQVRRPAAGVVEVPTVTADRLTASGVAQLVYTAHGAKVDTSEVLTGGGALLWRLVVPVGSTANGTVALG